MLRTKFQGHWSTGSGEEDFLRLLPYMGSHCLEYINILTDLAFIDSVLPGKRYLQKVFSERPNSGVSVQTAHRTICTGLHH